MHRAVVFTWSHKKYLELISNYAEIRIHACKIYSKDVISYRGNII